MRYDTDPQLQQVIQSIIHNTPPPPASPPPSAAPAPASSGGASATPSDPYDIKNDVVYHQALVDEQAALDAAASQRDAAINQALIQFGNVPDFSSIAKSLGLSPDQINAITGSLNPETGSLADQYTKSGNSVLAQLNQAHDQALNQLRANLAAHGTLESGATGVGTGLENQAYQHGLSNAYQTLLSNLLGFESNYTNAANSARTALENAASSAYDRAVQLAGQLPPPGGGGGGGGGGSSAPPPAGAQSYGSIPASIVNRIVPHAIAGGEPVSEHGLGMGYPTAQVAAKPKAQLSNVYTTGQKRFG